VRYVTQAARDATYLAIGLATSVLALTVWVAGVSVSASLAVFVVGLPAFVGAAIAFRWVAELDRRNAAVVLGRPLAAGYREHRGPGLLARVRKTARDPQTWRDLAWLVLHSVLGLAFGSLAVALVAQLLGVAVLPLWYWAVPDGVDVGIWTIDTLPKALAAMWLAFPLAVVTIGLLRGMAATEARLARALLGPVPGRTAVVDAPSRPPRDPGAALALHGAVAALVGFVCTLLWGLTTAGYFWPAWVWLGLATSVGLHAFVVRALAAAGDRRRALRVRAELCVGIELLCLAVWALTGGGYLWPVWPALGMGTMLALNALFVFGRLPWLRERALTERVDELTRTRRGALDAQAAELRRIERDLHDGAQARLVSLSMLIGRAEEQLDDRPEVADLVRRARVEASAAIGELRDLARGIAPPVLADRGLVPAVQGLALRAPMEVTVSAADPQRPPPVVETAAYFVVAEALTNAAKHAGGAPARVTIAQRSGWLVIEVADDGPGGADPAGSGLTGLRSRVEALDGELAIESPPGGGTLVRAELPCG
jgi:signal transduction histidine kinase